MTARQYTITEIDALRRLAKRKFERGYYAHHDVCLENAGRSPGSGHQDLTMYVEETVRTHMMAGLTAPDIIAQERAEVREREAQNNAAANG